MSLGVDKKNKSKQCKCHKNATSEKGNKNAKLKKNTQKITKSNKKVAKITTKSNKNALKDNKKVTKQWLAL